MGAMFAFLAMMVILPLLSRNHAAAKRWFGLGSLVTAGIIFFCFPAWMFFGLMATGSWYAGPLMWVAAITLCLYMGIGSIKAANRIPIAPMPVVIVEAQRPHEAVANFHDAECDRIRNECQALERRIAGMIESFVSEPAKTKLTQALASLESARMRGVIYSDAGRVLLADMRAVCEEFVA